MIEWIGMDGIPSNGLVFDTKKEALEYFADWFSDNMSWHGRMSLKSYSVNDIYTSIMEIMI